MKSGLFQLIVCLIYENQTYIVCLHHIGGTSERQELLYDCGADLIGIGDMSEVENCHFKTGISIAVALPKDIIIDLQKAPTKEYYDLYHSLNKKLNEIVMAGEGFLKERGFEAYAQTTGRVEVNQKKYLNSPIKR